MRSHPTGEGGGLWQNMPPLQIILEIAGERKAKIPFAHIILESKRHSETGVAVFETFCRDVPNPC